MILFSSPFRWLPISTGLLFLTVASTSFAQPRTHPAHSATPGTPQGTSLRSSLGTSVAQHLLRSPEPMDRLRGVQRLAGQNDYASIQILVQAVGDSPNLFADPQLRLETIRALAPFASRDPVRKVLVSFATDASNRTKGALGELARDQATMALAASSNHRAVEQLVLTIMDGGEASKRAFHALVAHPPRSLEPLIHRQALESLWVIELLGKLGDQRAIPSLRKLLEESDIDVMSTATVALAELGDASGSKLARTWINQEGSSHELRIRAARTLTLVRDPLAPRAIAILLADPATRNVGLSLAEMAPTPQTSPTLAGLLTIVEGQERVRVLLALARSGGPLAVQTLAPLAKNPQDLDAAFALAHCRDPEASAAISALLTNGKTRRIGARAALVRSIQTGQRAHGLISTLEALSNAKDDTDRSIGVFGQVILGRISTSEVMKSKDNVAILAACRASLGGSLASRTACSRHLASTQDPLVREALAGTLIDSASYHEASTLKLLDLAESSRPSGPVFGRLLGPRDTESFRSRFERLITSGDPDLRSQVAIGLGNSPRPSASTLLAQAYAFEPDPMVRRAILIGLATRKSKLSEQGKTSAVTERWLEIASRLDPDDQARSLARQALAGRDLSSPIRGDKVLWLRVSSSSPQSPQSPQSPKHSPGPQTLRLVLSNGFATVAVTAPDGEALVPGITPGHVVVRADGTGP